MRSMPTASCNGVELYYEDQGEGEPPALLCVMALGCGQPGLGLQRASFAGRTRTVVFDNRDIGRSEYVEDAYEISDMAADTLALADHLGLEHFHLLGVSMGGTISQEVALAAPERVEHPDARRHLGLGRELVEGPGGDAVRPQQQPHPGADR